MYTTGIVNLGKALLHTMPRAHSRGRVSTPSAAKSVTLGGGAASEGAPPDAPATAPRRKKATTQATTDKDQPKEGDYSGGGSMLMGLLLLFVMNAGGSSNVSRSMPAPTPVAPAPTPVAPVPTPVAPAPTPVAPAPLCPALAAVLMRAGHYYSSSSGCEFASCSFGAAGWAAGVLNRTAPLCGDLCGHTHTLQPKCGSAFNWEEEPVQEFTKGLTKDAEVAFKKWRTPRLKEAARIVITPAEPPAELSMEDWLAQAGAALCELILNDHDHNKYPASFLKSEFFCHALVSLQPLGTLPPTPTPSLRPFLYLAQAPTLKTALTLPAAPKQKPRKWRRFISNGFR